MALTTENLIVPNLGPRTIRSPLQLSTVDGDGLGNFVPDAARILYDIERIPGKNGKGSRGDAETRSEKVEEAPGQTPRDELTLEKAGPREHIFFDPKTTKAAIVTCGGLCPGLNNVIRSVYVELHFNHGVSEVLGIRYGYQGLNPAKGPPPIRLSVEFVDDIHKQGGTVLGSSRGPEDPKVVVDFLQRENIQLLFCVGGDGTQRGAHQIAAEAQRRGARIAVVGIPKTIDNDLPLVSRSFGYGTALEKAREVIDIAHVEAKGALNVVGLVKLMGREAGFIAAGATLASQEVNFTLIPEVPFPLGGENGFLETLKRRIVARQHAVVVVAEGAGQNLFEQDRKDCDASGNRKMNDIGVFLKDKIAAHFAAAGVPVNIKYMDPSYIIRGVPANGDDALLSNAMARSAVHAAMAGKTDVLIGFWHNTFIHVPIAAIVDMSKRVSPEGALWIGVLEATGQPRWRRT
jgi:6-phosphofructokinase 1